MWETWVRSLGREDPLEKEMATHSSTLARKSCGRRILDCSIHRVAKSRTRLSNFASLHFIAYNILTTTNLFFIHLQLIPCTHFIILPLFLRQPLLCIYVFLLTLVYPLTLFYLVYIKHEWNHMIFVFFHLIYFTHYITLKVRPCRCYKCQGFIFFYIFMYIYHTSLFIH